MINRLISKIRKTNAPIVVGLDPMLKYVPEYIRKAAFAECGETLEGAAEAVWQYNKGIVDEYRRRKLSYDVVKKLYHSYSDYQ